MNAWYFSGFGNYSTNHDWFSGVTAKVEHQVNLDDIYMDPDTTYGEWFNVEQHLQLNPGKRVFATLNTNGGSINVDGVILANTKKEAEALGKEYAVSFGVKEYED